VVDPPQLQRTHDDLGRVSFELAPAGLGLAPWRPAVFSWPALGLADVEPMAAWLRQVVGGIRREESVRNLARYLVGLARCGRRGGKLGKVDEIADAAGLNENQIENLLKPRRPRSLDDPASDQEGHVAVGEPTQRKRERGRQHCCCNESKESHGRHTGRAGGRVNTGVCQMHRASAS